jgi:Ca2+-binding RTX toxin-like protein
MPLPSATDVVNKFLYREDFTPSNLNTSDLTDSSGGRSIEVDTVAYFDPVTGPGRFALASKSALVEAFFSGSFSDVFNKIAIANSTLPVGESWRQADGSYRLTKADLAAVFGIDPYRINVANRSVADGYDDYAERTFIWGGTRAKLSDDVMFVIDPAGNRNIESMAIVPNGHDDFDWNGSDWITEGGENALQHAIDPSGIGALVELRFADYDPEKFVYTADHYQDDLIKESGWSEPALTDLLAAMQEVTDSLWSDGVTRFLINEKPIIYGSSGDDVIASSYTTLDFDVSAHSDTLGLLDLNLGEYADNRIVYQTGGGSDYVTGTSGEDVAYGGDGNDMVDGGAANDILFGDFGADSLFGGGGDDFIFFDAEDTVVNGGAGRDAGWAVTDDAITANMTAEALEVLVGGGGNDTLTVGDGAGVMMVAGGEGADVINVSYGAGQETRVLWARADGQIDPAHRYRILADPRRHRPRRDPRGPRGQTRRLPPGPRPDPRADAGPVRGADGGVGDGQAPLHPRSHLAARQLPLPLRVKFDLSFGHIQAISDLAHAVGHSAKLFAPFHPRFWQVKPRLKIDQRVGRIGGTKCAK